MSPKPGQICTHLVSLGTAASRCSQAFLLCLFEINGWKGKAFKSHKSQSGSFC